MFQSTEPSGEHPTISKGKRKFAFLIQYKKPERETSTKGYIKEEEIVL